MAELLVVANPRRRKRRKGSRKRHRKGRMPAALARYWATHGRGKKRRRRAHRKTRRHRSRRMPMGARAARGYVVGTRRIRRRKLNPLMRHHHRRRHRRHNPSFRIGSITRAFVPTVKAGGVGAVGALALDGVWGFVNFNLPQIAGFLTNPYVALIAKYSMAVAVGGLGGNLWRGKGRELAVGGATVVTHDFLKTLLQQMAPTIFGSGGSFPLGGLGSYLSGSAPIVGTATFPQTYTPWSSRLGSYLSGPSGAADDSPGVYAADAYGFDPWAGGTLDANAPWNYQG
jgi:hypothetical protein